MHTIISDHSAEWALVIGGMHIVFAFLTALHALLHKDDERAAIGWIGLVFLSPFIGSCLYWVFGVNRIKTKARAVRSDDVKTGLFEGSMPGFETALPKHLKSLMRAGCGIHDAPYLAQNGVEMLISGDEAYPRMLAAIDAAKSTIILSSYIFDYDKAGQKFVAALGAARQRNVAVYILLDGTLFGLRWRITEMHLRKLGVITARFLPFSPRFLNMRNHRKILCVDGREAFIGGLNIRAANYVQDHPRNAVQDVHFRVTGPVIDQIAGVFADDWRFATKNALSFPKWEGDAQGDVISRVLPDGPDENYEKLKWTLLSAINTAEDNIRIMTPYFVADQTIIHALEAASLRGVCVELMVPEKNNILFFNWAVQADFKALLKYGLKIYQSAPPFEHTKFFTVDDKWSFVGSANWDTRSLDLNFEINLECYDAAFNGKLAALFDAKKQKAKAVSKADYDRLSIFIQARNNLFRLWSPYL